MEATEVLIVVAGLFLQLSDPLICPFEGLLLLSDSSFLTGDGCLKPLNQTITLFFHGADRPF